MLIQFPADVVNAVGEGSAGIGGEAVQTIASNPGILVLGILLIVAAIVIFYFIKKLIVNSILGFIGWILLMVFVGIESSLIIPSLVVSLIFGLGGVGALLILLFFGVI